MFWSFIDQFLPTVCWFFFYDNESKTLIKARFNVDSNEVKSGRIKVKVVVKKYIRKLVFPLALKESQEKEKAKEIFKAHDDSIVLVKRKWSREKVVERKVSANVQETRDKK